MQDFGLFFAPIGTIPIYQAPEKVDRIAEKLNREVGSDFHLEVEIFVLRCLKRRM